MNSEQWMRRAFVFTSQFTSLHLLFEVSLCVCTCTRWMEKNKKTIHCERVEILKCLNESMFPRRSCFMFFLSLFFMLLLVSVFLFSPVSSLSCHLTIFLAHRFILVHIEGSSFYWLQHHWCHHWLTQMYPYDAIVSNVRGKLCRFLHQQEEHVECEKTKDGHREDNESLSHK